MNEQIALIQLLNIFTRNSFVFEVDFWCGKKFDNENMWRKLKLIRNSAFSTILNAN